MSVSTFGRVNKQQSEKMDCKEIIEKLNQNEKDITDLNVFCVEEFLRKQKIEDKREKDMWDKFSEHEKKLLNMASRDELSEKLEQTTKYIIETMNKMKHQLYEREIKPLWKKCEDMNEQISHNDLTIYNELERFFAEIRDLKQKVFALTIESDNKRKKLGARINALNKKYDDEIKTSAAE